MKQSVISVKKIKCDAFQLNNHFIGVLNYANENNNTNSQMYIKLS